MTNKISVTRALKEISTLGPRINDAMNALVVCSVKRKSQKQLGNRTIAEVEKDYAAAYAKVMGLIRYQDALKAKVYESNAVTKVKIAGKEYTVAMAIGMKTNSLQSIQTLAGKMASAYAVMEHQVTTTNTKVALSAETEAATAYGSKAKTATPGEYEAFVLAFLDRNEVELVTGFDIPKTVRELNDLVSEFNSEVDVIIAESNAMTFIEVDTVGL